MRAAFVACVLSTVASTFAYQVLRPNGVQGWTDEGPQVIEWEAVNTDNSTFTPVLVNENTSLWPRPQVLAAQVSRDAKTVTVNPPAGGWVAGEGFRVNFVPDADNLDHIYAQSPEFDIKPPVVSSAPVPSFTPGPSTPQPSTGTTPSTGNQPNTPNGSTGAEDPAESGNGALMTSINGGVLALAALTATFLL